MEEADDEKTELEGGGGRDSDKADGKERSSSGADSGVGRAPSEDNAMTS